MAGKVRHLLERDGRYFARLVVPPILRPFLDGKTELRTPLGGERRQALAKLPGAVAALQHRIGVAEQRRSAATGKATNTGRYPLTADEMAVRQYHSLVEFDAELRETDHRYAGTIIDEGLAGDLRGGMAGKLTDDALEALVGYRIDRFRFRGNTTAEKGSSGWRELAIKLCVSEYEALARVMERDEGDFTGVPNHPLLASATPTEDRDPVSLTGLLDDYLKELERGGKGAEARKRWTPAFADLVAFIRHNDATRLTKRNVLEWRDHLALTLAPRTIRDVHLASLRAVLKWAVENEKGIESSPAATVRVKVPKAVQSREKGFRDDEALAVLKATQAYAAPKRESAPVSAAKKWASLLCAFTGARIVEITQLRKRDIRDESGAAVARLSPDAGSIKNGQYRDVPLHPQLVDLGFLDFVAAAAEGPLFHSSKPEKALQGARTVAGRVSEWLQDVGVVPEGVSPNHGWRHRFKTIGRELQISDRVLDAVQGHAPRTAGDNYGDITIATKKAAIDKLPNYDLG